MSAYQDFCTAYEELFEAYKAADGVELAYARMVGALKVIVAYGADSDSLVKITHDLQNSIKNETMNILSKEHTSV